MTVHIDRITLDDEPRRRFFLLAEVTFSDRGGSNYYSDDELWSVMEGWVDAALDDRDDRPNVTFHSIPDRPAVREIWQWIIGANNGYGSDVDDLISILERHKLPCPADLRDE